MRNIIILSDFFSEDFKAPAHPGGAELNDKVLFDHLEQQGIVKAKIRTQDFSKEDMLSFLKRNINCIFLISNFYRLPFACTVFLMENCKYFIYEHDYKFHKFRNPIRYKNFIVPKNEIVNYNFFHKAQEVICLSKLHYNIFKDNMKIQNLYNTTCSLWPDEILNHIEKVCETKKNGKVAIVNSPNPIKRRDDCIAFARSKNLDYDLISSPNPIDFLSVLAQYEKVIILAGHPEPTPRIAVEAKMLNCKLLSNPKTIGVSYEEWFSLNGKELIQKIKEIREHTLNYITKRLKNEI